MDTREVKVKRILNPTSIDLGEYVINPFRGCEYACLYCYVRCNKVTERDKRQWGEYVDVRLNAPELLEKELSVRKPKRVLLGSTTECFQPSEANYRITYKILEILNSHKVRYNILTRSPLILDYISLLKNGLCESIYFTVNSYNNDLKNLLEPKSASFDARANTVVKLIEEKVPVIPYVSPLLPHITELEHIFAVFHKAEKIEFEGLNFNLGNIEAVLEAVGAAYPALGDIYRKMAVDVTYYDRAWESIKKDIMKYAIKSKKSTNAYIHKLYAYFNNKYR